MAKSLAHQWGQMIGHLLQKSVEEEVQRVADQHGLYLDYQRPRTARPGKKVTWQDRNGNAHDLDYVLERGGTETSRGLPAAFIETAWRRYTRHSRNKAQEIQGAILALAETYSHLRSFLGIVLAGEFTKGSLGQLKSCGFTVAYISYEHIVRAFATVGIDAAYEDDTEERAFRLKVQQFKALSERQITRVKRALLAPPNVKGAVQASAPIREFMNALKASLSRGVQGITVVVLHGAPKHAASATEAIAFIRAYPDSQPCTAPASKYEVHVRYNTGDVIDAVFQQKDDAIRFLEGFSG